MTANTAPSTSELIRDHVAARVGRLQADLLSGNPSRQSTARSDLARLRRARAHDPGDPQVWEITLDDMPTRLMGSDPGSGASHAEEAVHAALVLFAIHAQSATTPRHAQGQRLGTAVRALVGPTGDDAVTRRFHAFATATSWSQRLWHLRGLVTLMRAHNVPLDYAQLAATLYQTQSPDGLRRARLQWGRDYHRGKHPTQQPTEPTTDTALDAN